MIKLLFLLALLPVSTFAQHEGHSAPAPKKETPKAPEPLKKIAEDKRVPVKIPPEQQQKMEVKLEKVGSKDVDYTIRTVGTVTVDQTREAHVHTKINGWIETISADFIGKEVKKGETLFELYSPELVSTQEEYIAASGQPGIGREIARTALDRLTLWGVPDKEIQRLKKSKRSKRTIGFDAPVNGVIVNKTAINGMYITPEMELYHIADLSEVWIIVTLYENDLALIKVGDETLVELAYSPEKKIKAKINYIFPDIDLETRTAKARIEIKNQTLQLKPGMFTNVQMQKKLGNSITVPEDAVIDTGARKIVFVRSNSSQFEPREVKVGARAGGDLVVFSGLKAGEEIVTSSHFLIDAESKFQAAVNKSAPGHSSHGNK